MRKVVVFGYTKTGREIAKLLQDDEYELQIIDDDPIQVGEANRDGFNAMYSSINDDKILEDIGIGDSVEALFCASDNDSLNLFVTLSARNLDKDLKILTLIKKEQDDKKMLLAGANRTISPHNVGAIKAFRIIAKPKMSKVLNKFSLLKNKLSLSEVEIKINSLFDGIRFKDVNLTEEANIIFLGILDKSLNGEFIFFSKNIDHKIKHGDVLVLLGSRGDIRNFKDKIGVK
ncbi:MAG: NAD-binding protein [Sulfurospirillaceae bacterium]|nr:NAD-binding protein [Sulfurospirillaceae bacterium]